MLVFELNDQNIWNNFLLENDGPILQSWQWGELQKNCGRKVYRLAVKESSRILLEAQVIKYPLPFGKSYLYCPRGPIQKLKIQRAKLKICGEILARRVRGIARAEKAIFWRVDPEIDKNSELAAVTQGLGFKAAKKQVQPQNTLWLDLSLDEADLLAGMHHKTRYNIRLAERKGIMVRQSITRPDVDKFFTLMKETTARDNFSAHPTEYYQKQVEIFGRDNLLKLFLAEYQGEIVAAAIIAFFGRQAVYLHGASSYKWRQLMAPHLVQWKAIQEAKKRGLHWYDFWGIAPASASESHPWAGVTRFKRGFGGQEKNWIGALDLVYQKVWYWGYNMKLPALKGGVSGRILRSPQ